MGYEKESMLKRITVMILTVCLFTCSACGNKADNVAEEKVTEAVSEVSNEQAEVEKEELPPLNMIDDKYRNFYDEAEKAILMSMLSCGIINQVQYELCEKELNDKKYDL